MFLAINGGLEVEKGGALSRPVICAPIYSAYDGLSTQVSVGANEGLKHQSSVHCDELVSIRKSALTDFVGRLSPVKAGELDAALGVALGIA
jgi:mRNA interferase MazF